MREIIDSIWFTEVRGHIGIVAARTGMHDPAKGEWMAYIRMLSDIIRQRNDLIVRVAMLEAANR